ncbi:MAG: hypothetical protein IPL78_02240 [Chloroflexi bacterium]|nr:hypothetical protein [Chloroflexota bacterium]
MSKRKRMFLLMISLLVLVALACGGGGNANNENSGNETADNPTATAAAVEPTSVPPTQEPTAVPTDVPAPTNTPEPTPEPTAEPTTETVIGSPIPEFDFSSLPQGPNESGWTHYTNSNYVLDIVLLDTLLVAGTEGGIIIWDATTGDFIDWYTTLDGLPHNVVNAVEVCNVPDQTLFAGTEGGLAAYNADTDTWEAWTPENTGMGSDSGIDTLECAETASALVVGYDLDGVDIFESTAARWTYYEPFTDLESSFALALGVVGDLEEVWVSHIGAVSVIRPGVGVTYYDDENSNLDDANTDDFEHFVDAIYVDDNGTVWFGQGGGLTRVDGDNQFTFFNGDDIPGWPFFSGVVGIAGGPNGTLYTNTSFGGICQFDPATASCLTTFEDEEGMAEDFNNTILTDAAGHIYYASEGEGISAYDGAAWDNWTLDELPLDNSYYAISQGADGSIWVGGFFGAQRFPAYAPADGWEDLEDDLGFVSVNTFYSLPDSMWVGHSSGASRYLYASSSWQTYDYADNPGEGIYSSSVTAITQDGQGRMWFGTSAGVTVMDGDAFTYYDLLSEEEIADNQSAPYVYDILWDGTNVWVATSRALFRFDASDALTRFDETNTGLDAFFFTAYALTLTPPGELLVSVDDQLVLVSGDTFEVIYEAPGGIRSLAIAEDGLWIATDFDGAVFVDLDGTITALTTVEGLAANAFNGNRTIMVDYLGTVWFATSSGGLASYTP